MISFTEYNDNAGSVVSARFRHGILCSIQRGSLCVYWQHRPVILISIATSYMG